MFDDDTPEDRKARALIENERKAALFEHSIEQARKLPQQLDSVGRLQAAVDVLQKRLDQPQRLEAVLKQPTKPRSTVKRPKPADIAFAAATAHLRKHWGKGSVDQTLAELFVGDDGRLQRRVAKAATNPASTTSSFDLLSAGRGDWIEELTPVSIFGAMAAQAQPLPLDELASITMPKKSDNRDHLSGSFVGEGASIPVKSTTLGSVTIHRVKAAVLSVFTNELADTSTPAIESIIRRTVRADTAQMLDTHILNPANEAIAGVRPASPWFAAPNQTSTGTDLDSVIGDINWLIGVVSSYQPRQPVLIIDQMRAQRLRMMRESGLFLFRDEVERGELFGVPLLVSATVPTDKIYIIDLDDFTAWLPAPLIDVSATATVALADDDGVAPTMMDTNAVDSAGSIHIGEAGAQAVSSFQINATVLRHVQPVAYSMLRPSVAYITGVAW